jgi:ribosome recycling factor
MITFEETKQHLQAIGEHLTTEYASIHTGKASVAVLDAMHVESYGARQPIKNVASITVEDSKTLKVSPWDTSVIQGIERVISEADLGLSTASDGKTIRVIFPHLTEETRTKIVKVLKAKLEDSRIAVRKERERTNDLIDVAHKEKTVSDDDRVRLRDTLQVLVDGANANLEAIFAKKEESVMTI